jgi:amidase
MKSRVQAAVQRVSRRAARTLKVETLTDNLDAIIAPSYSFATSPAAVAGYPNIAVPVGLTPDRKPVGIWMYSTFLDEPRLLGFAYDLEQELKPRRTPQFLSSVPPLPPDAGICDTLPKTSQDHHLRCVKPSTAKRIREMRPSPGMF